MAMWCSSGTRYGPRQTLRATIERNCNSLPNVLLIGRDGAQRELVARMFHSASFRKRGVFTLLRCRRGSRGPKSELLSLFFALTRDGQYLGSRTSELLSGGTLFIDEIEKMDLEDQRICFEFLKQLQRLRKERPGETELRVVAGLGKDLTEAAAQGGFLPELLDSLDKVRVELDATRKQRIEPPFPKHALAGVGV